MFLSVNLEPLHEEQALTKIANEILNVINHTILYYNTT